MTRQQKNWYSKVKNRLHLDEKCSKNKAEYIVHTENISEHKFFPFIHFQIKQFKLSNKLEQRERAFCNRSIQKEGYILCRAFRFLHIFLL